MIIYKCKRCGEEIYKNTFIYGSKLCLSCAGKGRTHTKESREKMSKAKKGKPKSILHRIRISRAVKERYKDPKEREKTSKANRGKPSGMLGKKHTLEARAKMSLSCGGSGIPRENYDLALAIRFLFKYSKWRTQVFKQDNYTCQECSSNGHGDLEAHHLKPFSIILKEFLNLYSNYSPIEDKETLLQLAINYKDFWNLDNGQTLCKKCHKLISTRRIK
jgi:hypothetical protein